MAESGGEIVGHVAISPVNISDNSTNWFGLGPISVLPEYQGRELARNLWRKLLQTLKKRGQRVV
ncbi:GNAT family N-acetyltransferase [Microbulbifer sp. MLAF003]|nr:GNAT family N-acetyltransferase [Microbulbifer sp. MLAF003]WHI53459.1 GNAT family N-acetyltransferase [Microbulbifer sp. MLAF003]